MRWSPRLSKRAPRSGPPDARDGERVALGPRGRAERLDHVGHGGEAVDLLDPQLAHVEEHRGALGHGGGDGEDGDLVERGDLGGGDVGGLQRAVGGGLDADGGGAGPWPRGRGVPGVQRRRRRPCVGGRRRSRAGPGRCRRRPRRPRCPGPRRRPRRRRRRRRGRPAPCARPA